MILGYAHLLRPHVHRGTASIELVRRNLLLYTIRGSSWEATHHTGVVLRHVGRLHLPMHRAKLLLVGVGVLYARVQGLWLWRCVWNLSRAVMLFTLVGWLRFWLLSG